MPLGRELLSPPTTQEELNQNPIGGAIANYLYCRRFYENMGDRMQDNYKLLEPLTERDDSQQETPRPALTICIPVAINLEDEPTITCALDVIAAAQQKFARPIDVVLWANAKYADDRSDEEAVSVEALRRYESLRTTLTNRQYTGLNIRTALQVQPKEKASMGQIRTNYMEAVAVDAEKQDLGYDHPVMWVDTDLMDMSDKTLSQVVEGVQKFNALFVHPMTRYGIDWAKGQPLSEADVATKAVAIDEIMRRQKHHSQLKRHGYRAEPGKGIYHEESGLAFAIGTYLSIGGVPTTGRISESRTLIDAAKLFNQHAREHYATQHHVDIGDVPPQVGILPENIASKLTREPEGILYLPGSYTTMAARRQNERVRQLGPSGLRDIWTSNYNGLHVDQTNRSTAWTDAEIANELPGYIDTETQPGQERYLTAAQKARLGKLVARYFGSASDKNHES